MCMKVFYYLLCVLFSLFFFPLRVLCGAVGLLFFVFVGDDDEEEVSSLFLFASLSPLRLSIFFFLSYSR